MLMNAEIWSATITFYIATMALHKKWKKHKKKHKKPGGN